MRYIFCKLDRRSQTLYAFYMIHYQIKYNKMLRWGVFMSKLNRISGFMMKIIDAAIFLAIFVIVLSIIKRGIYIV